MTDYYLSSLKTPQSPLWSLKYKIDSTIGFVTRLDSPSIDRFADCKVIGWVLLVRSCRMTAQTKSCNGTTTL